MMLVVPRRHAWARRRKVTLTELSRQPLVLREAGSGLRQCFEKALGRAGLALGDMRVALELGSNEAIKEAVKRGAGVAVLSSYAVQKELAAARLHALRVNDLHCDRELFVVRDRRRVLPAPARLFLAFLESHPIPEFRP